MRCVFFFELYGDHRDLHVLTLSCPTRRSSDLMSSVVALSFRIGVQVAAPFLILAFVFNLGLALVNRSMPPLQVFFVGMPILLACGIAAAAVLLPQSIPAAIDVLVDWLGRLGR